jgi:hypothetical protein
MQDLVACLASPTFGVRMVSAAHTLPPVRARSNWIWSPTSPWEGGTIKGT